MGAGRVINLRQERRERGDADNPRHPSTDEYSRILGDEWEALGDGTYRFVGKQNSTPELRWADRPLASDDAKADQEGDPERVPLVEDQKKRRWRRH
jgi:hypothetical protein